jgi:predicted O-methyltransferase YrrM
MTIHAPKIVPEISVPNAECPFPQRYSMYEGMSSELEVLEFLHSLVRLLKPEVAIETGTYVGWSALNMVQAMHKNGFGVLHTAEPCRELWEAAAQRLVGYEDHVQFHHCTGEEMIDRIPDIIDFAFLDSNIDTRIREMRALMPRLKENGVVAVHDCSSFHQQNSNGPRKTFMAFAATHRMQIINLDSPRGVAVLRRWPTV